MKTTIIISTALLLLSTGVLASGSESIKKSTKFRGKVIDHPEFGEFYYYSGGNKGLILCFHGRGGSGAKWSVKKENKNFLNDLKNKGYRYLCPTSKNRSSRVWNTKNNEKNKDVKNIDKLIDFLKEGRSKLYLVGHSMGGGFVSRYALLSNKTKKIKAVQHSNASGLGAYQKQKTYNFPTRFSYASCDQVVSVNKIYKSHRILSSKLRKNEVELQSLDHRYRSAQSENCHEFLNTSSATAKFFKKFK